MQELLRMDVGHALASLEAAFKQAVLKALGDPTDELFRRSVNEAFEEGHLLWRGMFDDLYGPGKLAELDKMMKVEVGGRIHGERP
jgi:hypothetical protein